MYSLIFYFVSLTLNVVTTKHCPRTISTPQGNIRGTWMTTVNNRSILGYLGIPYAKPPVGPRRFKNPEPFGKWTSVLDGTKDPPPCPQLGFTPESANEVIGKEDCLYLNVYTPKNIPGNKKLPVMFFIYGGAFTSGACLSSIYGPSMLLDCRDFIFVCCNYRLGPIGFASTEDEELPGNLGLKDQVLALKWVQENIAAFGGNPGSVTIFGESAGGACVHYHMLSPLSKGLFHRAIPMSGTAYSPWAIAAPGIIAGYFKRFAEKVKCQTSSTKELVDCLSKVPASCLVKTAANFTIGEDILSIFGPAIFFRPVFEQEGEKSFITIKSYQQLTTVPMIIGATTQEGCYIIADYYALFIITIDDVLSLLNKYFEEIGAVNLFIYDKVDNPAEAAMEIKNYFFGGKDISKDTISELINMYSDVLFFECIKTAIIRHDNTAFIYSFGHEGPSSYAQVLSKGQYGNCVSHGDDLQYLFPLKGVLPRTAPFNDEEKKVSREYIDYFVNFATYGTPTWDGKPTEWTPTSKDELNYLLINGTYSKLLDRFQSQYDNFWNNINFTFNVIPWRN